jgi:lipopolysaccharide transport system permease protein
MASVSLFRPGLLRECWQFRGFIGASVKRDFVSRYLGTQLGWFWAIAQPLALILIYTLVFAEIMKPALPGYDSRFAYSIYLCAGLLLWQLFSDLVTRSVGVFIHNAGLLKKVSVPKLALPIIAALSGLASFAVVLALFLAFLGITGNFPWPAVLGIIPVVVLVVALAMGLGVLLGTVNVFYRDVEQSTAMVLQFWFWLTPIVYPGRALPEQFASVLEWNPVWPIVTFAQTLFLDNRVPDWASLAYPAFVALLLLALAFVAFRKLAGEIVDEL